MTIRWHQRPYKEALKDGSVKRGTPEQARIMRQREREEARRVAAQYAKKGAQGGAA